MYLKAIFILGWPEGGTGTRMVSGRENHPRASNSHWSSALLDGMSAWPSIWRLAPDVLSPRLLDLAAIDVKLVAVN